MLQPTCSSPASARAPEPLEMAVQRHPGGPPGRQHAWQRVCLLCESCAADDSRGALFAARKRAGLCETLDGSRTRSSHLNERTRQSEICSLHCRCDSSLSSERSILGPGVRRTSTLFRPSTAVTKVGPRRSSEPSALSEPLSPPRAEASSQIPAYRNIGVFYTKAPFSRDR